LEKHQDGDNRHDESNHSQIHSDSDHQTGYDPHIWLDPLLVKIQAETIKKALSEYDPSEASFYEKNYLHFLSELEQLHLEIRAI
jgi:zinc transport system substrate-binding protein